MDEDHEGWYVMNWKTYCMVMVTICILLSTCAYVSRSVVEMNTISQRHTDFCQGTPNAESCK